MADVIDAVFRAGPLSAATDDPTPPGQQATGIGPTPVGAISDSGWRTAPRLWPSMFNTEAVGYTEQSAPNVCDPLILFESWHDSWEDSRVAR